MLKIRLMGTKGDIEWFQKLMKNHLQVKVLETSDLYTNKGIWKSRKIQEKPQSNKEIKEN